MMDGFAISLYAAYIRHDQENDIRSWELENAYFLYANKSNYRENPKFKIRKDTIIFKSAQFF